MKNLSRRSFITTGTVAGLGTMTGITSCKTGKTETGTTNTRNHPLDGVTREKIKITDLKVTLLSCELPPEEQWYLDWIPERYKCWKTDSILVEVSTDQGIKGIGGATQYGGPDVVKKYLEEVIKPAITGKNPFDIEYLTCGVKQRGPMVGWAGVDAALWDIIGKSKGKPVYEFLATDHAPTTKIPVYASAGEMYDGDIWPDNLIEEALKLKERGFKAYKFRPGTHWSVSGMTMTKYIDGVWKLRDAVGPDFGLIQECNAQWNMDQTMQFIPEGEKMNLIWIEDPVERMGPDAKANYRKIKDSLSKVKLSYGGDVMDNRFDYKEWIDRNAMDIVQPDAGVMGLTESWYVSRMAHLQGQLCAPHNWHDALLTAANGSLAAGIPNLMMLETNQTMNPLRTDLLKEPLVPKDGFIELPNKPGFGIELIDDVEKRFPFIEGRYDRPRP
ncbi:MAG: mandelate racemase/muconate lactonizing enzyme family protein [Bacteroidetes bacterium]|nr:mandelate racemase/muconate lactonizing enzyme family protein [Bacteroidota bacterium]